MLSRISLRLSDVTLSPPRVERNGVAAEDLESGRGTNSDGALLISTPRQGRGGRC